MQSQEEDESSLSPAPEDVPDLLQQMEKLNLENNRLRTHIARQKAGYDRDTNRPIKALCSERVLQRRLEVDSGSSSDDEAEKQEYEDRLDRALADRDAEWHNWYQTREADVEADFKAIQEWADFHHRQAAEQIAALEEDKQKKSNLLTHMERVIDQNDKSWRQKMEALENDISHLQRKSRLLHKVWHDKVDHMREEIKELEQRNAQLEVLANMTDKEKAKMKKDEEKARKNQEKRQKKELEDEIRAMRRLIREAQQAKKTEKREWKLPCQK